MFKLTKETEIEALTKRVKKLELMNWMDTIMITLLTLYILLANV